MELLQKIAEIQKCLVEQNVDGWLLYDHHGSNRFVHQLLSLPKHIVLTRRFFYWIPKEGEPCKIAHRIEGENLENIPGQTAHFLSWQELEQALKNVLIHSERILMEYSPKGANPYVSVVDAGTVEMIREMGIEVLSSADLLQRFTSVLSYDQIASHLEAAFVAQKVMACAWNFISESLKKEKKITEYDVQQFILAEFASANYLTEEGPICAVNEHSAMPHYLAIQESAKEILEGDFILIDLWCKKAIADSIYADITQVAVAAAQPTPRQQLVFEVVKIAQQKAVKFVRARLEKGQTVTGAEVDDVCRSYVKACGFGEHFTHRTGHNIDRELHGAGAHLDNLETSDYRQLLAGMCFSIEPGIYLAGEFGVRLESDLLLHLDGTMEITGGTEENIICLL